MNKKNLINLVAAFSIIILTVIIIYIIAENFPSLCISWPKTNAVTAGRFSGYCGFTTFIVFILLGAIIGGITYFLNMKKKIKSKR
jgi:ABC-type uncharacterized transport system permease subunit